MLNSHFSVGFSVRVQVKCTKDVGTADPSTHPLSSLAPGATCFWYLNPQGCWFTANLTWVPRRADRCVPVAGKRTSLLAGKARRRRLVLEYLVSSLVFGFRLGGLRRGERLLKRHMMFAQAHFSMMRKQGLHFAGQRL